MLYSLQGRNTPLHLAASLGHTSCVEHLLSTPGIDVNIKDSVSWSIEENNTDAHPIATATCTCVCTCVYDDVGTCLWEMQT